MTQHTHLTVERVIDAPAGDIFDLLTHPGRHHELDASGTVGSSDAKRIQAVGEVFTMHMAWDDGHGHRTEYQTANHVTGYSSNRLVAWKPGMPGEAEPFGWEWLYELEPHGSGSTLVRLTYDWKDAPKELVAKYGIPCFDTHQLEASLGDLAAAVAG